MADKWFAECAVCKWQEAHDSQSGAIEAASNHVAEKHQTVMPEERARRLMGHVQLRTELAPALPGESPAGPTQEPTEHPQPEPTDQEQPAETSPPDEFTWQRGRKRKHEAEG